MQYTININQRAWSTFFPECDLDDITIFLFCYHFSRSSSCQKVVSRDRSYYWFSHSLIINENPLLRIRSKSGIKKRLLKLCEAGLLVKHEDCQSLSRSYYAIGHESEKLFFYEGSRKTTPCPSQDTPLSQPGHPPCPSQDTYHNTIEHKTKEQETPNPQEGATDIFVQDPEEENTSLPSCPSKKTNKKAPPQWAFDFLTTWQEVTGRTMTEATKPRNAKTLAEIEAKNRALIKELGLTPQKAFEAVLAYQMAAWKGSAAEDSAKNFDTLTRKTKFASKLENAMAKAQAKTSKQPQKLYPDE